ncbi:MAG: hypothetical protein R3C14_46130 [Caldilineaceae bacterium]
MSFRVRDPGGANISFREVTKEPPSIYQWLRFVGGAMVVLGGLRLVSWLFG